MIRAFCLLITIAASFAHEVSESFLRINATGRSLTGVWEASLRDLEVAAGLDANHDDHLTWGEIVDARPKLDSLLARSINISNAQIRLTHSALSRKSSGNFLALNFAVDASTDTAAELRYDFMFAYDREHRVIVTLHCDDNENISILTAGNCRLPLQSEAKHGIIQFLRHGVIHIWSGTDHILFLLALLLPTVIAARTERTTLGDVFARVAKIVTAFTVAHSITLGLGTLDWVRLPSRVVESVIAFSVMLAATNNIAKIWNDRSWLFAFVFGLIHGFGFASALTELQLQRSNLMAALISFNCGVEIGQLAIVAMFLPVAFALQRTKIYRRVALIGGSAAIIAIAGAWLIERAFAVTIF